MRVAIIDLGTNSVRFDVHALGKNDTLLHREKLMIRLGQGVFVKGRMDSHAIDRTVHAFAHFRRVADALRVRKVVAFGTSALREAHDSASLLERVKTETGIEIRVISGKEEAKLIALGVLTNEKTPVGRFALVDIGGGSTEISFCRGKRVLDGDSFPLGTARLQQLFLKRSPPKPAAVAELRAYIRNILGQHFLGGRAGIRAARAATILGSSGTVRAVAKVLKEKTFTTTQLSALVERMSGMTTTQLLGIPGMEPKRVDMIFAGAVLLEEVALALGAKRIRPSDFSLRDGILEEERRLFRSEKSSLIELHLDDLFARAARFRLDEGHLRHMSELAAGLFERLAPVHGLPERWKIYLLATVILRNCGEIIGFAGKEKHAYYVVKHADFPAMEGWEHEFIARLCLHLPGGKLTDKDLAFLGKDAPKRAAFRKLLALARVVDALDLGPRTKIQLRRVEITRLRAKVCFSGVAAAGAEQLWLERKKKLFEQVFGRELVLERRRGRKS